MAKKPKDDKANDRAGAVPAAPYVVLARKYRPRTFEDMVGQDALVQTLRNAFASGRIAQAYMLTGTRGIGKTTTARILARALNYERDGVTGPTVDMPELGRHCAEIMESRHPDVFEMDAASNTGIDDIREIIENARYKPIVARYKVFIIDEVHMLSKAAFNGLLKTLEEPPEHVKFVFATTEIRKVPITVLSRCQRFDLRRIDADVLVGHFRNILDKEGAAADDGALRLISRAAEGSVRDGLSILDQAIAMGSGEVKAADVRAMLGLADRGRILDLFEAMLSGRPAEALGQFARLHKDGADPLQVLADLGEASHLVTRARIAGPDTGGDAFSGDEKKRIASLAAQVSVPLLTRAWQMLVKGLEDAARSPNPLAAAEMVLIRIAYTADLPSPDELMRVLGGAEPRAVSAPVPSRDASAGRGTLNQAPAPARGAFDEPPPILSFDDYGAAPGPDDLPFVPPEDDDMAEAEADIGPSARPDLQPVAVNTFADVVALASRRRDVKLKTHLEEHVSLVKFDAAGAIEIHLLAGAPKELGNELRVKLNAWTGRNWMIALSPRPGQPTLGDVAREQAARDRATLMQHPAVVEVLKQFPDAKISTIRPLADRSSDDSATG
jgi:DNA polymerase-3 subunit gamma/tau